MTNRSSELAGSPQYWAWLYSPPEARAVLEALLALEAQIAAALVPGLEHHVAHVRLDWWREECARYGAGTPTHPLTRTLLSAYEVPIRPVRLEPGQRASSGVSRPHPGGLVDTALWDLARATFATRAELTSYCERWSQGLTEIAALGAARHAPHPIEAAGRFGRAIGAVLKELELLGNLDDDARRGWMRLPLDELERIGVEPSAVARPPWPTELCRLVAARHYSARSTMAQRLSELDRRDQPALRGLIVWAAVAHRRSRLAERALPRPWKPGSRARFAEVAWSWRAARHADRRQFRLDLEDKA